MSVKVTGWPVTGDAGLLVKLAVGGTFGGSATVIVAVFVSTPPWSSVTRRPHGVACPAVANVRLAVVPVPSS